MVFGDRKDTLGHRMLEFARQWMKFVMTKCERGRGTRPRYEISPSAVLYIALKTAKQSLFLYESTKKRAAIAEVAEKNWSESE